jgi:hypothetical protein
MHVLDVLPPRLSKAQNPSRRNAASSVSAEATRRSGPTRGARVDDEDEADDEGRDAGACGHARSQGPKRPCRARSKKPTKKQCKKPRAPRSLHHPDNGDSVGFLAAMSRGTGESEMFRLRSACAVVDCWSLAAGCW